MAGEHASEGNAITRRRQMSGVDPLFRLQTWLRGVYDRFGTLGLYAAILIVVVPTISINVVVLVGILVRVYFGASGAETAKVIIVTVGCAMVGVIVGTVWSWRIVLIGWRWSHDEQTTERAIENWQTLSNSSTVVVAKCAAAIFVLWFIPNALIVSDLHRSAWQAAPIALYAAAGISSY
jgi:hypothetical protein